MLKTEYILGFYIWVAVYLSQQKHRDMTASINKSQVLKKAWNDFRTYNGSTMTFFAQCLKDAWAYFKERAAMGKQGAQFFIQEVKMEILDINYRNTRGAATCGEGLSVVRSVAKAACGFASDVAETVLKYGRASEKQAYVIARAAYDLGI